MLHNSTRIETDGGFALMKDTAAGLTALLSRVVPWPLGLAELLGRVRLRRFFSPGAPEMCDF